MSKKKETGIYIRMYNMCLYSRSICVRVVVPAAKIVTTEKELVSLLIAERRFIVKITLTPRAVCCVHVLRFYPPTSSTQAGRPDSLLLIVNCGNPRMRLLNITWYVLVLVREFESRRGEILIFFFAKKKRRVNC